VEAVVEARVRLRRATTTREDRSAGTGHHHRAEVLVLFAVLGCARGAVELSLDVDPEIASVLIVADDGDAISVRAHDVGRSLRVRLLESYVGAYAVEVTVFGYSSALEAVGLGSGDLEATDVGSPIPNAAVIDRTTLRGDAFEPWTRIDRTDLSARIAELRLRLERSPDQCVEEGGCFDLESATPDACVPSCPAPQAAMAPLPPASPDFSRCSGGWTVRSVFGTGACVPFVRDEPCAPGETELDGACLAVGTPCPAGPFAEGLGGSVRYAVSAGPPGDGSLAAPHGSLEEALLAARIGDTIALAKGAFGSATLDREVRLVGACAAETSVGALTVTASAAAGTLTLRGGVEITGSLTITDAVVASDVAVRGGARLDARRALIALPGGSAVHAQSATIAIDQAIVLGAGGVRGESGSTMSIVRALARGASGAALEARASRLSVDDSVVADAAGSDGVGIRGLAGATLVVTRTIIERIPRAGVFVDGEGSEARLVDVQIRDVGAGDDLSLSNGIHLEAGTRIDGERIALDRIAAKAIDADGTIARVTDVSIRDAGGGDCHACVGLCGFGRADVEATRLLVEGTQGRAVHAKGSGSHVVVKDATIRSAFGSAPCVNGSPSGAIASGQCAGAIDGGSLEMESFGVAECTGVGVLLEQLFEPGGIASVRLERGVIAESAVGVQLGIPGYPISRVADRVLFRNNEVDVLR
jgi:hypothetical protein